MHADIKRQFGPFTSEHEPRPWLALENSYITPVIGQDKYFIDLDLERHFGLLQDKGVIVTPTSA
jgi:hypothetical protein